MFWDFLRGLKNDWEAWKNADIKRVVLPVRIEGGDPSTGPIKTNPHVTGLEFNSHGCFFCESTNPYRLNFLRIALREIPSSLEVLEMFCSLRSNSLLNESFCIESHLVRRRLRRFDFIFRCIILAYSTCAHKQKGYSATAMKNSDQSKYLRTGLVPPLKMEVEVKFCHECGGWGFHLCLPCRACNGSGVVRVSLPVVKEISFAQ